MMKVLCNILLVWSVLVEQVILKHSYKDILNQLIRIYYQKNIAYSCVRPELQSRVNNGCIVFIQSPLSLMMKRGSGLSL